MTPQGIQSTDEKWQRFDEEIGHDDPVSSTPEARMVCKDGEGV